MTTEERLAQALARLEHYRRFAYRQLKPALLAEQAKNKELEGRPTVEELTQLILDGRYQNARLTAEEFLKGRGRLLKVV